MHSSQNNQRGSAFLMIMLMAVPMFVSVGLVVDVGWAYYTRQAVHAAAEAAALAAVQSALDGIKAGGTYTCGSQALACQSATACPASIPSPTTSNLQNGCAYAIANGFTNGGPHGQIVTIAANTTSPLNGINVNYWVTAHIAQQNPLTFGAVLGGSFLDVGATATAAAVNILGPNCLVALNSSANGALSLTGHVTLAAENCGVAVDSNSSSALKMIGSSTLTAGSISLVGGSSGSGMSPTPTTGVASFGDPLEGVPAPAVPSGCTHPAPTVGASTTYYPGNYCGGLSFGGGGDAIFSPGTYFLVGGGLSVAGNATLTGSGVTFYNTFNATYAFAPISLVGTGTLTLSAPTTGSLQGMLFFEDRNAPTGNTNSIVGNSGLTLAGAIYSPKNELSFSGDAGSEQIMIVADTVTMNGNVHLDLNPVSATPITPQISSALIG
ncbi:MAG: pilus assembly protein TadG-related protein [Bryobacteraceae bacterium]